MSAATKQTAVDYLSAVFHGDAAGLRATLKEDFRLWVPQSSASMGLSNPITGRERLIDTLTNLGKSVFDHRAMKFDVLHVIGEGDLVAVHYRLRTHTQAGAAYDNTYIFLFRFDGGAIAEAWEQTDTAYAYGVFGGTPG